MGIKKGKIKPTSEKLRRSPGVPGDLRQRRSRLELREKLAERLIGQSTAIEAIVPQIELYEEGFAPPGRPAGVFLLLGPTGCGKSLTAEALAQILHGNSDNLIYVDCGEYQHSHEIAKLIGAPPGYLGHRETQAVLSKSRLVMAASEKSKLAIILFDEIEKGAPELHRLLLGITGRGKMALGDNSPVDFTDTLILMTSNLGSREMTRELEKRWGFGGPVGVSDGRLDEIAIAAARKRFDTEFINRIDQMIVYHPLTREVMDRIVSKEFQDIQHLIAKTRVYLLLDIEAREWILENGFSRVYGARELKRVMRREILIKFMEKHRARRFEAGTVVVVNRGERGLEIGEMIMEAGAA